jgi:cysteine desulfurase
MNQRPIYLDYNATTPIDPAVRAAMTPYLEEHFGNPSSSHAYGQSALQAVDTARRQVADLLGSRTGEIVFTGGGSEASNLAIKGVLWPLLFGDKKSKLPPRIITSAIEHPATLRPLQAMAELGCQVEILPVDRFGVVSLDLLKSALREPTCLVSIMHSNNEVGTLQPIREIAELSHAAGALLHCDAAQSLGKMPVDVRELGIDLLTVAGHKLYAPKGIGALYVREQVTLEPLIHGAGHEGGRRAGTENVPYIVALGEAAQIAQRSLPEESTRLKGLRDRLWRLLQDRLPNTLNVSFVGWIGSELLGTIPGIAASTGSACHEGQVKLSPVLQAMGIDPEIGKAAVRLTVGRFTTGEEVDRAAMLLSETARK